MHEKEFNLATQLKRKIEDEQRLRRADMKRLGKTHEPRFFEFTIPLGSRSNYDTNDMNDHEKMMRRKPVLKPFAQDLLNK